MMMISETGHENMHAALSKLKQTNKQILNHTKKMEALYINNLLILIHILVSDKKIYAHYARMHAHITLEE